MSVAEVGEIIANKLPGYKIAVYFDVGANVGQTTLDAAKRYPTAAFYAFEPVPQAFQALHDVTKEFSNVRCFNTALGATAGVRAMRVIGVRTDNFISRDGARFDPNECLNVAVDTGDAFCEREKLTHISYLKIDTEGFDLQVLEGFKKMIAREAIDLIEAEVSLNGLNRFHVAFAEVHSYLESFGYRLFALTHLTYEFGGRPHLRRCNSVYISEHMIRGFRGSPKHKSRS